MKNLEIERRWLVDYENATRILDDKIPGFRIKGICHIAQCYVIKTLGSVLRIRHKRDMMTGEKYGEITMKGDSGVKGANDEYEMIVPYNYALDLIMESKKPVISKNRISIPYGEFTIELDVFKNVELEDLVIAEVEFPEMNLPFEVPAWFGEEITGDKSYSNSSLSNKVK